MQTILKDFGISNLSFCSPYRIKYHMLSITRPANCFDYSDNHFDRPISCFPFCLTQCCKMHLLLFYNR